ncbi:MAG TPA: hypothetical protein VEH84_12405, partial [Alphaproteobacteria bacterium]|nr:hypothetical protein [Alphaproteobacteria bacterium]
MPPASPGAAGWDGLARELDLWGAAGRVATLWWRDDDAVAATPALDRLLAPALPLTLAVIPAAAEPGLAERLRTAPAVTVAQHGWSHADHAPPGAKSIELGGRPAAAVAADLAAGRDRLAALFGERFRPVLVPPWNRIDPAVLPLLPGLGYAGLSTFTPRRAAEAAPRVVRVNSHV